jgi:hypothetical protein
LKKILIFIFVFLIISNAFAFNNERMLLNLIYIIKNAVSVVLLPSNYLLYESIGNNTATNNDCGLVGTGNGWCNGGSFNRSSSQGGFSFNGQIALDKIHGYLYVADAGNLRIQKIDTITGITVSTIGYFSTNGTYIPENPVIPNQPGLAIDQTNQFVFIADIDQQRVMKFNSATSEFVGSVGLVASATSGMTCTIGTQSGWCKGGIFAASATPLNGSFSSPRSIFYNSHNDNLYILNDGYNQITIIQATTGETLNTIFFPTQSACNGGISRGTGLVIDDNNQNYFYTSDQNAHCISRFNLGNNNLIFSGSIGKSTSSSTTSMSCTIGAQNGWCTGGSFISGVNDGELSSPGAIIVDPTGNQLIVSDTKNNRIQKFNLTTGAQVGSVGQSGNVGWGNKPCVAGAQSDWCNGGLFQVSSSDGGFMSPIGIAIDISDRFLYTSDSINGRIQRSPIPGSGFPRFHGFRLANNMSIYGWVNINNITTQEYSSITIGDIVHVYSLSSSFLKDTRVASKIDIGGGNYQIATVDSLGTSAVSDLHVLIYTP